MATGYPSVGRMSQQHLADIMRERGFRWAQVTVYKNEMSERVVSYGEAVNLAQIFGAQPPVPAGYHPLACPTCLGNPPKDFTCNVCGEAS